MGEEPNNPVDSLYTIDTASAPVQILSLENVLQRRADYEKYGGEYHEKSGATQSGS